MGATAALSVGRWLYPFGSINHDEPICVFQARLLSHGHLTLPASFAPFRPWASGVHGGRLVLKYTPIWPGVLAIADKLGSMRLASAAAAFLAVFLTGLLSRDLFGRSTEGLLAAAMMLMSPLFLLQTGTYLPYLFQLVLDLAVLVVVLGALREWPSDGPPPTSVWLRLVSGGALWGIALFARPYDAVLLAVPVAGIAVATMWSHPRRLLVAAKWSAIGASVPVAALLAYNRLLMGSPLRNTFMITSSNDTLGFGARGVFETSTFNFTPGEARLSLEQNLLQLPGWIVGGALLILLGLLGLWRHRRRGPAVWGIAALAVSFSLGYAIFWSPYSIVKLWPGARTMGPFYHLPLLIPLAAFAAAGLAVIFDRSRVLGGLAVVSLVVVTLFSISPKIDRNRSVTDQYKALKAVVDQAHLGSALLFIPDRGRTGFESATPFLENDPSLRQPVIYALEDGPGDFAILDRFPGRTAARMRTELRSGDPLLVPTRSVERLHVRHGPAVTLRFRIVNTVGAPIVRTTLHVDDIDRVVVLDTDSTAGATYDIAWTLEGRSATGSSGPARVVLPNASGTVDIEADFEAPGHATERYQRQYAYAAERNQVRVLTPGLSRHLFQFGTPTWLNEDVNVTLSEAP